MADVLLNQGEKVVLNNSGAANIIVTNPAGSGNMNLQNPGGKIAFPDATNSAHALLIGGSHLLWRDTSLILRTDARFETPMLIARGTVTIDGNETDAYIRLERSGTAKWQIGRFGTGDDLDFLKDSGTGWMKLTYAGGQLQLPQLGSGAGILLGGDANLYRSAADVLKTDDSLEVNVNLTVAGNIVVAGTVDGVDVSAHAANVNAHHAQTHGNADHTGAPTPSQLDIGDGAVVGTDAGPARGDHQHAFPSPATGYPLDVAASEADGTATTTARADHVHAHGSGYLPNAHHAQAHGDGDHSAVYALLAGRAGGQTLIGGTGSGEHLQLQSTSHATKGRVQFHNTTNYIDASGNLTVVGNISASGNITTTAGDILISSTKRVYFDGGATKYAWMNIANAEPLDTSGTDGRIALSYNLFIRKFSGDLFADPPQMWIGQHRNDFLYMVIQETAAGSGSWQAAVQTVRRPKDLPNPDPPIAQGYGFHPLRLFGKNFLTDLGGHLVTGSDPGAGTFLQQIYFQKTLHIDHITGQTRYPDHYTNGRPYDTTDDSKELGGVAVNQRAGALSVRIYRNATKVGSNNWTLGDDLVFEDVLNPSPGVKLSQLVRGAVDRLKIATGETGLFSMPASQTNRDFGTVSLPAGLFSSPPKIFLTARNSASAWSVGLTAYTVTAASFGIMGQNNYSAGPSDFFIQWMAVGT